MQVPLKGIWTVVGHMMNKKILTRWLLARVQCCIDRAARFGCSLSFALRHHQHHLADQTKQKVFFLRKKVCRVVTPHLRTAFVKRFRHPPLLRVCGQTLI